MKEKKNTKLRKTLLMMTSVVLVAAISVGATLAYLTAQTAPIKNEFRSASNIQGKVIEPNFVPEDAMKYKPGKPVPKDPCVDNNTSGKKIYAGLKLEFFIKVGGSYTPVTFTNFSKFVDIATLPSTSENLASALSSDGSGAWHYVNTDSSGNLYYLYDKQLDPNDMDTGAGLNAGGDTSNPIFSTVTVKSGLKLDDTKNNVGNGVALTADDITGNSPLSKTYTGFDYKIKITGYGVTVDEAPDIATARTKLLGADMMNITAA